MSAPRADVLTTLRHARERLTPDGTWTQGDFAQQRNGLACAPASPHAVCWCLQSAIVLGSEGFPPIVQLAALEAVCQTIHLMETGLQLVGWNDAPGRTQDDVLEVLDKTIARLEREEGQAA